MWLAAIVVSLLTSLIVLPLPLAWARGQSPPRALPGEHRRLVISGSDVHVACPVEPQSQGTCFFEWFRGEKASVPVTGSGERIRVSPQGALKIRAAVREDTDSYVCRAVNGFGSVDVPVTLIVLAGNEEYEEAEASNLHPEGDDATSFRSQWSKPELVQVTQQEGPILQRPLGSTLRLKCEGTGNPRPQVTWLKDGRPLSLQAEPGRGTQGSRGSRWGRWTLLLPGLMPSDAGLYTCLLHNPLGDTNATFLLQVVGAERAREKPEMEGDQPTNTSVIERAAATLKCRVRSIGVPHIQWLKQVSPGSSEESLIQVEGESYKTVRGPSERVLLEEPDHIYVNKLHIAEAGPSDAGKYVCLAANSLGYSFRSAHLAVTSRKVESNVPFGRSSSSGGSGDQPVPFPIVVAASVLTIALVVCLAALLIRCRHRLRNKANLSASARKGSLPSTEAGRHHCHGHAKQLLPSAGHHVNVKR